MRFDDIDVGEELGVERLAPDRRSEIVRRRSLRGAGGIDEDVDRPEARFHRVDHHARRRGVGEVGGDAKGVLQFGAGSFDIVARARRDGDPRPLGREG